MTPTSEERREVAERLRKEAGFDEWLDLTIENAIFGVFGEVRRPAADTLADLIDPTCEVVPFDEESMRLPHCSVCMQPILKPWPNFCPNCGARVVERGEH